MILVGFCWLCKNAFNKLSIAKVKEGPCFQAPNSAWKINEPRWTSRPHTQLSCGVEVLLQVLLWHVSKSNPFDLKVQSPSDLDLCIVREKDDKPCDSCDGFDDDRKELATLASWAPADKRSTMSKLYYITFRWTWLEADTFNMQIHRIQVHPDTIHPGYMPMLHWWFVAITPSSTLAVGALGLGDQCDQLPAEIFWLWEQKSMIWKTRRNR
jgi:hypothetical protein